MSEEIADEVQILEQEDEDSHLVYKKGQLFGIISKFLEFKAKGPSGTLPSFDIEAKYPILIYGRYRIPNLRY
jgi:hypothetical protein